MSKPGYALAEIFLVKSHVVKEKVLGTSRSVSFMGSEEGEQGFRGFLRELSSSPALDSPEMLVKGKFLAPPQTYRIRIWGVWD